MRKNVSEPWFSLIALGLKKVEGRLDKGDFAEAKAGDTVTWVNSDLGFERRVKTKIVGVTKYTTFQKYLKAEGLQDCLPAPGVKSIYLTPFEKEHCFPKVNPHCIFPPGSGRPGITVRVVG